MFLTAVILFVLAPAFSLLAEVKEVEVKTSAVCQECKNRIELATMGLTGVIESDLDLETKKVKVRYDSDRTSIDKIRKSISYAGYYADDMKPDKKAFAKLPAHCKKSSDCCDKDKKATKGCCDKDKKSHKSSCDKDKKAKKECCSGKKK